MAKKSDNGDSIDAGSVAENSGGIGSPDPNAGNVSNGGSGNSETGNGGIEKDGERIAGVRAVDPTGTDESAPYGYRADGTPARKRGRKPGSAGRSPTGTGTKARKSSQSLAGTEKLLLSLHMMAAAATKTPEIAIDKQEAEILANAINAVQEHYAFDVSETTTIWVNLITALAGVYGPRIYVIFNKKKKAQENKPRPVASVSNITEAQQKKDAPVYTGPIPGMHDPVN